MNIWLVILLAGLITFAIRLSFIVLMERMKAPEWFLRALRFVPAAVLSAIAFPELMSRNGSLFISARNPELWAGIVAIFTAWRTRNILLTIAMGMASLLVLQFLLK